ncbi:hypothetical protein AVEN_250726-1 [Araneus ventricosus]|uniref:Uncharacterized protein n=1 Tax=Araneus ventricosus TaxID=182803 RepID=A0A4Y2LCE0_ARAVE|nr:hypothetical protein AVEN_250726-1 [Araneus ventricosus]
MTTGKEICGSNDCRSLNARFSTAARQITPFCALAYHRQKGWQSWFLVGGDWEQSMFGFQPQSKGKFYSKVEPVGMHGESVHVQLCSGRERR